jgi:hypothetical protein
MKFEKKLSLVLTYRCNVKCRHCIFRCSPERREKMEIKDAFKYIDEATKMGARTIGITGGEPTLYMRDVLEIISYTKRSGYYYTTLVSNGYWGYSKETAHKIAEELHASGLDLIALSKDVMHQEFIPESYVDNCISACRETGIKLWVQQVMFKKSQRCSDTVSEGSVFPLLPVGRDKELDGNDILMTPFLLDAGCEFIGSTFTVHPDGEVYPCCRCSQDFLLRWGNARKKRLSEIVAEGNLYLDFLKENGPLKVAKLLEYPFKKGYTHRCHLCNEIFESPEWTEKFKGLVKENLR